MLVLLSSAVQRKYRDDILRVLAMPLGSIQQFRYRKDYVEQGILNRQLNGTDCLVCYTITEPDGRRRMIPVRKGIIRSFLQPGSTVSIRFQVGEFVSAPDIKTLNEYLNNIPKNYFLYEGQQPLSGIRFDLDLLTFEENARILSQEEAFKQTIFWTTLDLVTNASTSVGQLTSDLKVNIPKEILSGKEFTLRVYHYRPRGVFSSGKLELVLGPELTCIDPPSHPIDSSYDLIQWRVQTSENFGANKDTWINIKQENLDCTFNIRIGSNILATIFRSVTIGTLIAAPSIAGDSVGGGNTSCTAIALKLIFGWIAGFVLLKKVPHL